MPATLPPPKPSLTAGVGASIRGLRRAAAEKSVRKTYLTLVLAMVLIGSGLQILGVWGVWEWTRGGEETGLLAQVALWILRLGGIAVVLLAAPLAAAFVVVIFFPFLGERVFFAALRAADPERAAALMNRRGLALTQSTTDAMIRLLLYLGLTACVLALGLIPVVGGLAAPPLQAYLTARSLAWELLDPYFDHLGYRFDAQHAFVKAHRASVVGFGLPWSFVMAVPFAGPLMFGLAQAAVATLVTDVLEAESPAPYAEPST